MEKTDLKELRKVIKAKDHIVDWVYCLYVDSENTPVYETVGKLADMEEGDRFRHLNLFTKVLSTRLGQDSFAVSVKEQNEALLELRESDGKDIAEFEEFREALLNGYAHTDPYYATLARIAYDVPKKASDGTKLEDGDLVYQALILTISTATLSKPVLGLDVDHVAELKRRWQIGNPGSGFLYPAYSERMEDRWQVLVHSANPDMEDFINRMFGVEEDTAPVGIKAQKNIFSSLLGQMDVGLSEAAAISENIVAKAAEGEEPQLEKETLQKIVQSAGISRDDFDEIYEETVGETPVSYAAIADPYVTVRTDSAVIKVPAEQSSLIRTRVIDGREYILIPADGAVTVNGIAVSAAVSSDADDQEI